MKALARTAYNHGYGFTEEPELPEGWQSDAFAKLARLEFYADRPVATADSAAYGAAWSWGQFGKYDDPDDPDFHVRQQKYDDADRPRWSSCSLGSMITLYQRAPL